MLGDYLNQTACYTPALRNSDGSEQMDDWGQTKYGSNLFVKCRKQAQKKEILTPEKQTIQITDTYYTTYNVLVGDLMDGRRVQYRDTWFELDGSVVGYKVVV